MALGALWQRLTPLDRILVLLLAILCAGLFALIGAREPGTMITVQQDGAVLFTAPLDSDRKVSLSGPLGVTELLIRGGEARIVSSPCPFKVCIGMGSIDRAGQMIACVPNRLLVEVDGPGLAAKETDYDLLSR